MAIPPPVRSADEFGRRSQVGKEEENSRKTTEAGPRSVRVRQHEHDLWKLLLEKPSTFRVLCSDYHGAERGETTAFFAV